MLSYPATGLATRLSPLDLALVAFYLVAITLFGLRFAKRGKQSASLKSYFLADNTIPWWAIALSIVSAETSTLTIISVPGIAFAGDLGFLQLVFGYMTGRIVVAWIFLPLYMQGQLLTAYQLIDRRFGPVLHKVTAGLFLLTRAAAEGVRVFAISIVVSIAIGTGDVLSIALISVLTLLYTFEGGMAAVIWTDVVQMALYVAGTLAAVWSLGAHVPGGWAHIHTIGASAGKFHLFNFAVNLTSAYTFWAGVLGGTFLTMASHGTDQLMVQRLLAARNLRESRLALLSSGVVIFLQFTLFLLIGIGLYVFYGGSSATAPDRLFPTFIVQHMPHGIAGLLIAAILAAAMSNLSAALNSLSSTTVVDFYLPVRKWQQTRVSRRSSLRHRIESPQPSSDIPGHTLISRLATIFWAIVLFAIAVYSIRHGGKGHVVETGLSIASVAYGSLLGVFLLGTLTKSATQLGTTLAMLCGFLLNLYLWRATHIAYTWYVLIGAIVTFLLGLLFSRLLPKPRRTLLALLALSALLSFPQGICCSSAHAQTPGAPRAPSIAYSAMGGKPPTSNAPRAPSIAHSAMGGKPPTSNAPRAPSIAYSAMGGKPPTSNAPRAPSIAYSAMGGEPPTSNAPSNAPRAPSIAYSAMGGKPPTSNAPRAPSIAYSAMGGEPPTSSPPGAPSIEHSAMGGKPPTSNAPRAPSIAYSAMGGEPPTSNAPRAPSIAHSAMGGKPPTSNAPSSPQPQTPDFSEISTLLNAVIAAHKLPGAVVLIGHNNQVVFHHAYGLRKLAGEPGLDGKPSAAEPMTEDTIFDMASLTKVLVTSTAILQLNEAHKLDLDAPVAQYLPEFAANGKSRITIRQLLTHYSGLPEDVDLKDTWGLATPDKAEGIRRALASIPYAPPGQTFKYSDINFITLGALVEKLSGQTLDLYARANIFFPLKLTSTAYHPFDKTCGPAIRSGSAIEPGPKPIGNIRMVCLPGTWNPLNERIAPTAHDDQGTPATNPNFDHLLRGTVHDPTTRRMGGVAGHAGVFSTAEDMSLFCQALLDKLTKNTGPFPLTQATLQLATSPQAPSSAHADATIFTPDGQPIKGIAQRGLGWDLNSAYSRPRGEIFPIATGGYGMPGHPGSFGHTGFTGTSLWLDPTSNTYVILLANAIHPRGAPPISTLRGQVATASARAFLSSNETPSAPSIVPPAITASTSSRTQTGVDVLESTQFAALKSLAARHGGHLKLALLTNQSGIDSQSRRTIDILAHADSAISLEEIFSPEHGLFARQDTEHLTAESDPATHLPVLSLYGPKPSDKRPRQSDLKKVDAVVIDLQDAGVRFWTYETVLGYFLEDCARAKVAVIVLDRPNPIGGLAPQGPLSDPGSESYINFMPLPVRHAMTFGELARYFNENAILSHTAPDPSDPESMQVGGGAGASATGSNIVPSATRPGLHAELTVLKMQNWRRDEYFAETGLPWVPPSPNMRTPDTNIVYPAVALIETTNMSVGRGSPAPYQDFGAPFLNANELAAYLTARNIPGIAFSASTIRIAETPERYPFHGQTIPAIHLTVTDRNALDSPELGIELLAALHHLYPAEFQLEKAKTILLNAQVLAAIRSGKDSRDIASSWQASLHAFQTRRESSLLYP